MHNINTDIFLLNCSSIIVKFSWEEFSLLQRIGRYIFYNIAVEVKGHNRVLSLIGETVTKPIICGSLSEEAAELWIFAWAEFLPSKKAAQHAFNDITLEQSVGQAVGLCGKSIP